MQNALSPILVFVILLVITLGLIIEVIAHNRRLKSIPVRITVTGTRGKTSVSRILASILRETGKKVIAKTTGTEAVFILPDGSEEAIKRRGAPNILEQKKLVKKAAVLKVDYLISELMSIQMENHRVESQKIFKPDYTIITNLRPDHLNEIDEKEMWKLYANDIYEGSTVIIPENEINDQLIKVIEKKKARLFTTSAAETRFQNNILAGKLASLLGCSNENVQTGIDNFVMDKGETNGYLISKNGIDIVFINSFAANDPVSSTLIIEEIRNNAEWDEFKCIGLLSLRNDRGERSKQWLNYVRRSGNEIFDRLYCLETHSGSFRKSHVDLEIIKSKDPIEITNTLLDNCHESCLIFGLANIGGPGLRLLDHWASIGKKINVISS